MIDVGIAPLTLDSITAVLAQGPPRAELEGADAASVVIGAVVVLALVRTLRRSTAPTPGDRSSDLLRSVLYVILPTLLVASLKTGARSGHDHEARPQGQPVMEGPAYDRALDGAHRR